MKIRLLTVNKKSVEKFVLINRSSLKNYAKFSFNKKLNKIVWSRKDIYDLLKKQLKKKIKSFRFEKISKTNYRGKKYIYFRFSMWRVDLQEVEKVMQMCKKRYNQVKNEAKFFELQRIGLSVASEPKQFDIFTNKETHRKNHVEVVDFIPTEYYARNDPSTVEMFEDIKAKIKKYLKKLLGYPSRLEFDDAAKEKVKDFYVFFEER